MHAELNRVELVDRDILANLLRRFNVTKLDVDKLLFPTWDRSA